MVVAGLSEETLTPRLPYVLGNLNSDHEDPQSRLQPSSKVYSVGGTVENEIVATEIPTTSSAETSELQATTKPKQFKGKASSAIRDRLAEDDQE